MNTIKNCGPFPEDVDKILKKEHRKQNFESADLVFNSLLGTIQLFVALLKVTFDSVLKP